MAIRDRIKELRRVPASELKANPKNWRTHPPEQLEAIRAALSDVGFAGAELARELEDGTLELIDGHARAEVSGDEPIPVLVLDVTEDEADTILATFDPIGAMATKNTEALSDLLKSLADDATLPALVFPDYVIDPLLAAEWEPPAATTMPSAGEHGQSIKFSASQWETVESALGLCREVNTDGGDLTDGQCVELICSNFIHKTPSNVE